MRRISGALWQDLVYAIRGYLRTPFFTAVAVSTLALGIGATTVVFSVLDAVVLQPLPYPQSAELVAVAQMRRNTAARLPVSPPNYFDLKERSRVFAGLAAYGTPSVTIAGAGGDPEKIIAATCTEELFGVLRVAPAIGRAFTAEDTTPGAEPVALVSNGMWKRRFGADPLIVGRGILVDNAPTVIVGVMPDAFEFPIRGTELWVPMRLSRTQPPNPGIPPSKYRQYRILSVVARLRPGVPIETARAETSRIADALAREYPDANYQLTSSVTALHDVVVGSSKSALILLLAAVCGLLLIACANASSLILVRAAGRTREMAIRHAMGAGRGRLITQMLVESVVLALAGGAAALLFAAWAVDAFVRFAPSGIPRIEDVHVNLTAAGFALAIAGAAGVLFGVLPALHIGRNVEQDALRGAGRGSVTTANRRTRHGLVVVEIALSTILTIGASLLIQTFVRLSRVDTGFRPASVVAVDRIELPRSRASLSRSGAFFEQLIDRIHATGRVDAAAVTIGLPLDRRARFFVDDSTFTIARRPALPVGQRPSAALHVVSGEYFAAVGIPLKRGRWFDARDRADAPAVVIINEAMARRYWPGEDPLGQTLTHDLTILPGQPDTRRVVGIVGDVRHFGLERAAEPQMFIPHLQMPWPSMALVVRSSLPVDAVNALVREVVHGLDATLPIPPARPLQQIVSDAVGQPRFRAGLVGMFAASALLLAMIGLYGTIAFSVHQRTRELGLRIALGASPRQATRLVLISGLKLALAGAVIGLAAAAGLTRLLAAMLFGVAAADPVTFVIAPLAIVAVAMLACYLPARRVRTIEPLRALVSD
ncbi:MAG TPA: ABC transporter permease [Vicinamibacterales bacterium]